MRYVLDLLRKIYALLASLATRTSHLRQRPHEHVTLVCWNEGNERSGTGVHDVERDNAVARPRRRHPQASSSMRSLRLTASRR